MKKTLLYLAVAVCALVFGRKIFTCFHAQDFVGFSYLCTKWYRLITQFWTPIVFIILEYIKSPSVCSVLMVEIFLVLHGMILPNVLKFVKFFIESINLIEFKRNSTIILYFNSLKERTFK